MSAVVQLVQLLSAFVVLAEALNKMERVTPFAAGLVPRARAIAGLKALAWLLLAMGASGAFIGPFINPLGIDAANAPLLAHLQPSFAEVCTMTGIAVLIVRHRLKNG